MSAKFEMFNVIKDGETSFLVCVPQILIGLSKRSVNAKIEKKNVKAKWSTFEALITNRPLRILHMLIQLNCMKKGQEAVSFISFKELIVYSSES